jgi:DNA gyrase subunit A
MKSSIKLLDYSKNAMRLYGIKVNEDRAVPCLFDGLKPVNRRILWWMKSVKYGTPPIKAARIVGGTMGEYHPHGDISLYEALVNQVQSVIPTIYGKGNFGSLTEPAAAMRYPNASLSKYGGTFVDPVYVAVTPTVPNYDNKRQEPVYLPALYPNLLLNGNYGIGVALSCHIPAFTFESLMPLVIDRVNGVAVSDKQYARKLKLVTRGGGSVVDSDQNKESMLELVKTGRASIQFTHDYKWDGKSRELVLFSWPRTKDAVFRLVEKIKTFEGVESVIKSRDPQHELAYVVKIKRLNDDATTALLKKIEKELLVSQKYEILVTLRRKDKEHESVEVKLFAPSIPQIIDLWVEWRIKLEQRALKYRLKQEQLALAHLELVAYAVNNIDVIVRGLKRADTEAYLMKALKLTAEQINTLLEIKLRALKKLDYDALKIKIKEQKAAIQVTVRLLKNPDKKVAQDLSEGLRTWKQVKR